MNSFDAATSIPLPQPFSRLSVFGLRVPGAVAVPQLSRSAAAVVYGSLSVALLVISAALAFVTLAFGLMWWKGAEGTFGVTVICTTLLLAAAHAVQWSWSRCCEHLRS